MRFSRIARRGLTQVAVIAGLLCASAAQPQVARVGGRAGVVGPPSRPLSTIRSGRFFYQPSFQPQPFRRPVSQIPGLVPPICPPTIINPCRPIHWGNTINPLNNGFVEGSGVTV